MLQMHTNQADRKLCKCHSTHTHTGQRQLKYLWEQKQKIIERCLKQQNSTSMSEIASKLQPNTSHCRLLPCVSLKTSVVIKLHCCTFYLYIWWTNKLNQNKLQTHPVLISLIHVVMCSFGSAVQQPSLSCYKTGKFVAVCLFNLLCSSKAESIQPLQ